MIDLTSHRSNGSGILAKLGVKKDGAGFGAGLLVSVDIAFDVKTEENAETVDRVVPGARALFRRKLAGGEDRARISRSPSSLGVLLSIQEPDEDLCAGLSVIAQVKTLSFVDAPKFSTYSVRFAFVVGPDVLADLASRLEETIEVSVQSQQTVLPFLDPFRDVSDAASDDPPDRVEIDSSGKHSVVAYNHPELGTGFGRVIERSEGEIVVENFGPVIEIDPDWVIATVQVIAPDSVLDLYVRTASGANLSRSWSDLITALGCDYSESESYSGEWEISREIVYRALFPSGRPGASSDHGGIA